VYPCTDFRQLYTRLYTRPFSTVVSELDRAYDIQSKAHLPNKSGNTDLRVTKIRRDSPDEMPQKETPWPAGFHVQHSLSLSTHGRTSRKWSVA